MKTEKQIVDRLVKLADKLSEIGNSMIDEGERENPPPEKLAELTTTLGMLLAIGWVLDQEEEMKQLMTTFKVAGSLHSLRGIL